MKTTNCPIPFSDSDCVLLAHGGGGRMTHQLISNIFYPAFRNSLLEQDHDGCVFRVEAGRMACSTDSFVVDPIFFPGGDIGDLAVNGTVNDLACCGARPLYLTAGFILEEGLPFVDLAYLRKSDLRDNVITYRRRKTGRPLSVTLTSEAMAILKRYMDRDSSSPYLFPLLNSREGTKEAYHEYQLALRNFNRQLMLLGEMLGLGDKLSSYTARHTWATTAYYCEIHPGVISEAMGHSSITVTETYLKPFQNKKIDEANKKVVDFIKRSMSVAIC